MAKQKSLIYNSVFNVFYQLLNVIFPFVTAIYVSHILMAEGVGKVAYAQNIASYFVAIAPLGLVSYGVKEIAKVKNNPVERNKCFSELFLINAVSTAILALIYYVTVFCMDSFTEDKMLFVVCGFPILLNFINVEWFYQGMEEYAYITVRSLFTKIASMLLMFLIVRGRNDYVQYALITSFVGSANRIFNMVYLRKLVRFRWINLDWKKHMKPMFILACNIFLANIYSKVDITMLGYWKTDAITGYYANAFKIVNIILSVCSAITDVFLPRLSFIFCGDRKKYTDLLNFGMKIVLAIIFPTFAGMVMLASSMIPILFGNSFIPAVSTVQLLSLLILIKGFGNLACYQVAISSGNERKQTLAYVIGCIVNVVLNALLIPGLNQNGAAIASVISELVLNAVLFIQLREISGIHIKWSYMRIVLNSCIIMMVFVEIVLKIIPGQSAPWLAIAVGVAVYTFSGYLQGNQVIMDIFQKMIKFIRKKHISKF